MLSHISGPTLINTINAVRQQRARVEGSEPTEQFAQLAAVHAPWYHQEETRDPSRVGCGKLDAGNFHMILKSRLYASEPVLVPVQVLANRKLDLMLTCSSKGKGRQLSLMLLLFRRMIRAASSSRSGRWAARLRSQQESLARRICSNMMSRKCGVTLRMFGDQARSDRRLARSMANLTPDVFADYFDCEEVVHGAATSSTAVITELAPAEERADEIPPSPATAPVALQPHRTP